MCSRPQSPLFAGDNGTHGIKRSRSHQGMGRKENFFDVTTGQPGRFSVEAGLDG